MALTYGSSIGIQPEDIPKVAISDPQTMFEKILGSIERLINELNKNNMFISYTTSGFVLKPLYKSSSVNHVIVDYLAVVHKVYSTFFLDPDGRYDEDEIVLHLTDRELHDFHTGYDYLFDEYGERYWLYPETSDLINVLTAKDERIAPTDIRDVFLSMERVVTDLLLEHVADLLEFRINSIYEHGWADQMFWLKGNECDVYSFITYIGHVSNEGDDPHQMGTKIASVISQELAIKNICVSQHIATSPTHTCLEINVKVMHHG